jgi:hypothetical protein
LIKKPIDFGLSGTFSTILLQTVFLEEKHFKKNDLVSSLLQQGQVVQKQVSALPAHTEIFKI